MRKETEVIAIIQEPHTNNNGKFTNDFRGYDVFPGNKENKPRTAIIASKHLNLSEVENIGSDTATAVVGEIANKKIMMASIYLHSEKEVISESLQKINTYCLKNKYSTIMGICLLYTSDAADE